ncbi:beta-microseminoprotein-like [Mercenaria mercenaria]|uniref:beta-microseminoprotein-like n=1 Tax=Mercenaria mercenaria TaxID=6596 RepID=UPI00234F663B|nr:beta-microseminoprotein-like [Mercenaria mercenaria]
MSCKALFVVFIQVLLLYCDVESLCWVTYPIPDDNGQNSTCEYKGWEFKLGASFKSPTPYCEECTCTANGLSCCGYGKKDDFTVFIIPGCVQVDDDSTCDRQFVDSTDETQPCSAWERKRSLKNE